MSYTLHNPGPSCSVTLNIRKGHAIHAAPGSVVTCSAKIRAEGSINMAHSIKNAVVGQTLAQQTISLQDGAGDDETVLLAPSTPSDINVLELPQATQSLLILPSSYLFSDVSISATPFFDTSLQRALFGRGIRWLRMEGRGRVAITGRGHIHRYNLAPGEVRLVDRDHLVGYSASLSPTLEFINQSSIMSSFLGGEFYMFRFEGPGLVLLQSHNDVYASSNCNQSSGGTNGYKIVSTIVIIAVIVLLAIIGMVTENQGSGGSHSRYR